MSKFLKLGLLGIIASLLFVLPAQLGGGSAKPAEAATGDLCQIQFWSSAPNPPVLFPQIASGSALGPTTFRMTTATKAYFAIRREGQTTGTLVADIDDLTGDADITSVMVAGLGTEFIDTPIANTNTVTGLGIFAPSLISIFSGPNFPFNLAGTLNGNPCFSAPSTSAANSVLFQFQQEISAGAEDWDTVTAAVQTPSLTLLTAVANALQAAMAAGTNNLTTGAFGPGLDTVAFNACVTLTGATGGPTGDMCTQIANWVLGVLVGQDFFLTGLGGVQDGVAIVDVTCLKAGLFEFNAGVTGAPTNNLQVQVQCFANASASQSSIAANPASIEIVPAPGNVSHSLVTVVLKDSNGNPAGAGIPVDFRVDNCAIETSAVDTEAELLAAMAVFGASNVSTTTFPGMDVNVPSTAVAIETSVAATTAPDTTTASDPGISIESDFVAPKDGQVDFAVAAAVVHCDPAHISGAKAGKLTVTAIVNQNFTSGGSILADDVVLTTTITVVGPPASITVAASPTSLRCGEKSTITATIKDAAGQNVSEHTRVEAITNAGGVLGGTGAVANLSGPVVPISSTVGEAFAGQVTFFLLTSEQTTGPYEVVVTSGGTGALGSALGGVFSTPPVSAQVTVTCTIPAAAAPVVAPAITAPRTGQGITPPNTGDAGLAASSGSSSALFAIFGVAAFAIAGLATLRFARR